MMAERTWTLADITHPRDKPVEALVQAVRADGAAVIPGFAGPEVIAGLREDYGRVLADRSEAYIYPLGYEAGEAVSITRNPAFAQAYPRTDAFFSQDFMARLVRAYIGTPHLLNHELYATHETDPQVDIAPTHFDKLWTLKFMLYLNDVGLDQGAFGVIPGSGPKARKIFRDIFDQHNLRCLKMSDSRYQDMQNCWWPEGDRHVVDIVGAAGTLVIFDTDTYHHAGRVQPDCERMILRGHSGPSAIYRQVRRNGRQWRRGESRSTRWDAMVDRLVEYGDRLRPGGPS